jgi:shikimate dehydrogenase
MVELMDATRTRLFGVIGDPIGHSLGPIMHNAALSAMEYPGVYLAFEVQDLAGALRGMRALKIGGLSVTIPHKRAVMDHLDEIDELAVKIGAVNTVLLRDGRLLGFNTDCHGAVAALAERIPLAQKRAAVLGAGGAARAVAFGLQAEGARVTVFNRGRARGERLAAQLGAEHAPLAAFDGRSFDLAVNTTAVGMAPLTAAAPVPADTLHPQLLVMDIVYNPLETRLLTLARLKGCAVVDGVEMFVRQGARQLEIWTGRSAPLTVMRQAVLAALQPGTTR